MDPGTTDSPWALSRYCVPQKQDNVTRSPAENMATGKASVETKKNTFGTRSVEKTEIATPKARNLDSIPELPLSSPQHTVRDVEKHQHLSGTELTTSLKAREPDNKIKSKTKLKRKEPRRDEDQWEFLTSGEPSKIAHLAKNRSKFNRIYYPRQRPHCPTLPLRRSNSSPSTAPINTGTPLPAPASGVYKPAMLQKLIRKGY